MKRKIKLCVILVVLLAIMTAIFVFSSQPGNQSRELSNGLLNTLEKFLGFLPWFKEDAGKKIRKLAHFVEFSSLGLVSCLLFCELFYRKKDRRLRCPGVSAAFCFLYACSDEIHQIFVPGRSCELKDILLDSAGAVSGIAIALLFVCLTEWKAGYSDNEDSSS